MYSILVQCHNGVTYHRGNFRTLKEARIKLFDSIVGVPKELWSIISDDKIVNHTCSGDNTYSVVPLKRMI